MKITFYMLAILTGTLLVSCDDECICDSGPYYADLRVKLTINDENPELFLTIFAGKIESGDTLIAEYVDQPDVYYEMEAGHYYAATVTYTKGSRQITAIDGKKMNTDTDDCGCDYGQSASLNLRLAD